MSRWQARGPTTGLQRRLYQPQLRTNPGGLTANRVIRFRRDAGQEVEYVLHLREDVDLYLPVRPAHRFGQRMAVVQQCLVSADLDIDRRQTPQVGVQRIGQRML